MTLKIITALLATLSAVVLLIIAAAAVALNWPCAVVNPTTLAVAARHLAPLGIRIEWSGAGTSSISHGFFDETLGLSFEDLCVAIKPSLERACFSKFEASFRYRFRSIVPELVAVGPVKLTGGDVIVRPTVDEGDAASRREGALPIPEIRLPGIIAGSRIHPIEISVNSFAIEGEEPGITGRLDAAVEADDQGRISVITISGGAALPGGESAKFEAEATSGSNFAAGDWRLDARADVDLVEAGTATIAAKLSTEDGKRIGHSADLAYRRGPMRGKLSLEGTLAEEAVSTRLKGSLDNASEFLPRISLPGCSLELVSENRRKNRGKLTFSCPVDIRLPELGLPEDMDPIYAHPKNLVLEISADANTFFYPDPDQKTRARLAVKIKPVKSRLVRIGGALKLDLEGVPSEPADRWKISSDADLDFTVDRFAELVKALGSTPWPVPAPLNVLDGTVEFSIEGSMSSQAAKAVLPAKLRTRLESAKQRIFVDSDGSLELGIAGSGIESAALDLEVALADVQLQLPDISPGSIPGFAPDGRIELAPKAESKKKEESKTLPFDYRIKVVTPSRKPLKILSNLTPEHVPIAVDLDMRPEGISGTVSVLTFPVKLFSREATIEHFDLTLREPAEKSEIQGRISLPYIDMTILIELAGTFEEPSITLASRPPMSRGDIISTLMYGEPLDALDSDNADSVGNMNAAMANSAITLTSFFLLSSTPIQSIGYNPDTRMFSARIKLAEKTSLKVGSSTDEKEIGIRQRLGKGWSITTGWEKSEELSGGSGAASAYIEWSKRY